MKTDPIIDAEVVSAENSRTGKNAGTDAQRDAQAARLRERFSPLSKKACSLALSAALVTGMLVPTLALASESASPKSNATAQQGASGAPDAPDMPSGDSPGAPPDGGVDAPGGGANTQSFDYTGTYSATLTTDGCDVSSSGESVEATESSQNAALAQNGGTLTIENDSLSKSGDLDDGDSCNFYGVNSIVLGVGDGSQAYLTNSQLSATSEGSNGIFATDNATVFARGVQISTTAGNSRGLDSTYGGTIVAGDMDISTQGDHCAAFATDRGGGYISVNDADVSTAGSGSPLLYSTGAIEVANVAGTATGSQLAGMEGLNSIRIYDSELSSTITSKTASDPIANGVIIYQSTSGDADTSTGDAALFQAVDSSLSSAITSGSMFYLTNTSANVVLENTALDFNSENANLVLAAGNDSNNWGSAGKNGATVTFTGIDQELSGAVEADTISSVDLYLTAGTTWTGYAVISDNEAATSDTATESPITVNVDATSSWVVTKSCTVSNLNVAAGGKVVDESGNAVTIKDASGQILEQGSSNVVVTVENAFSTDVETTDSQEVSDPTIDRADYDAYYATSTALDSGSAATTTSAAVSSTVASAASASTAEEKNSEGFDVFAWIADVWNSIFNAA
mgnify:CR=1 FL=1